VFFLSVCASDADKGRLTYIPKLGIAGSNPVARSNQTHNLFAFNGFMRSSSDGLDELWENCGGKFSARP
jgi:hypothetical protein